MCGRFTITLTLEELMLHYYIDGPAVPFHVPRYNVAPGQMIPAIINDGETNRLGQLRWGLIPSWAKDEKIGYKMINARAETLAEKPAFRTLIQRKRVLIPADGFYEWKAMNEGKQPMRIVLKKEKIFSFAGLYDIWISPSGEKISSCTIITTQPNKLMQDIHDRMPVILHKDDERTWLDRENQDKQQLLELLVPYPAEEMEAYPVAKEVGSVKNDSPDCIKAI